MRGGVGGVGRAGCEILVDGPPELAPGPVRVGRLERRDGIGPAADDPAVETPYRVVALDGAGAEARVRTACP